MSKIVKPVELLLEEIEDLTDKLNRARTALAKQQYPDGEREDRVAEWLRTMGYVVTKEHR